MLDVVEVTSSGVTFKVRAPRVRDEGAEEWGMAVASHLYVPLKGVWGSVGTSFGRYSLDLDGAIEQCVRREVLVVKEALEREVRREGERAIERVREAAAKEVASAKEELSKVRLELETVEKELLQAKIGERTGRNEW